MAQRPSSCETVSERAIVVNNSQLSPSANDETATDPAVADVLTERSPQRCQQVS